MAATSAEQRVILLIDDQEADVLLIRRALQKAGLDYPVLSVSGGIEALAYLNGDPPFFDRNRYPLPALVLLDVRMPRMDGFEVLTWIRSNPQFAALPIVMLTGAEEIGQAKRAYEMGATSFFVKPLDFGSSSDLSRAVRQLIARGNS